ncbi:MULTISPECIES: flagellar hook assembly protein FlgD [unclassified Pseudomonas]|uniref:flagellar hook assembly protein FlgD n=1 Tax=unclassified Pseudomonas TaxID=196821 RepID=UPI00244A27AA|nr:MULTISPECIES: flagellar hook assembly protein FlgD [unclassified Pseudomonas]MDH0300326.1 flagellar hook assembly protein FlgD [Pseudomonas sp. GD04091]MDH1986068.1 flagellar hook assembly protein FlgD [Pseudomonas sp. GD03689]
MTTTNTNTEVGSSYLTSLQKPTSKNDSSTGQAGSALGKDAFLQLLVTQMKNQNPLDPQDNGEFVAQLAQFSSLEGIQSLKESVDGILTGIGSSQALQATSLVGRSVIVQSDKAVVDTTKSFTGQVVVPQNITEGKVTIKDKDGKVVKTIELPAQKAGTADFIWDGTNDKGEKVDPGNYTFTAETKVDGKAKTLATLLPAKVNSVSFQNGSEMMLDLAGIGKVGISKVTTIGI